MATGECLVPLKFLQFYLPPMWPASPPALLVAELCRGKFQTVFKVFRLVVWSTICLSNFQLCPKAALDFWGDCPLSSTPLMRCLQQLAPLQRQRKGLCLLHPHTLPTPLASVSLGSSLVLCPLWQRAISFTTRSRWDCTSHYSSHQQLCL